MHQIIFEALKHLAKHATEAAGKAAVKGAVASLVTGPVSLKTVERPTFTYSGQWMEGVGPHGNGHIELKAGTGMYLVFQRLEACNFVLLQSMMVSFFVVR
jgi:hypothetical protein